MRAARRLSLEPPELNLVPMLDMVSLLIQLLLINAQFGAFAEVPTALGAPSEDVDPSVFSFQVLVSPTGYRAAWSGAQGTGERDFGCGGPCERPEQWDTAGLADLATTLKAEHPEASTVVVVPEGDVSFDVIVRTMDALRGGPEPFRRLLFQDVVLGEGT